MAAGGGAGDALRIKILTVGDGGVGKSCLVKRYCEGKFVSRYIATIGIDYGVKPVQLEGRLVKVNFWDLSGHPEFFEVRNEFYKDSQGVLLVFDLSAKQSFDNLEKWLEEAAKFGAKDFVTFVCGCKLDKPRAVRAGDARAWAESKGFRYFEASNKTGEGVVEMFTHLFTEVVRRT